MLRFNARVCATLALMIPAYVTSAQACGWYAISVCSTNYGEAQQGADLYGGYVVNTDDYENFAGGYFCSVVGPKTKQAAQVTARRMRERGARTAYIKYTC